MQPAILRVLIEVFRQAIEKDFVKENLWPELVPQLKLVIQRSNMISPGQHPEWNTINALTVLQSVVRPFEYFLNPKVANEPVPEQLEHIAAEILVPLQVSFHHFADKVLLSHDGIKLEYEQLVLITGKCMYFTGPPVASAASKRKKGDKSKGKGERSSIGELLVIPFLSKFIVPTHGEDASSKAVQNYFGILMAYGGLQDFLTEKKELTITLIRNQILPLHSLDPSSPYLISTANWIIGQLALCLPEAMSTNIYNSLMKTLTMEEAEDLTCYLVRAYASGAIAALLENGYASLDWLALLQGVVKRISTEDENESALLFQLLGTIVEAGQEQVLPHIPEIVSNIANTIAKLLPPIADPWPQMEAAY